ncbi:MAG: ribonuclease PH [Clostridia bacterium]|nr:ribonuclease PH [Clostridia bacterium]
MREKRKSGELRKIKITKGFINQPCASVLIEWGNTKVLCSATVEERVPPHVLGSGAGWVTAEYSMLPASTATRNQRDINKLKLSARSAEIQRLIGRSLRAAVDMKKLGERQITVDCDVLSADGGTRCASVTGGFIALALACKKLVTDGVIEESPIINQVAAVSVGIVDGEVLCDLEYVEDSAAEVDMNVVMTDKGSFVELQGTGEHGVFADNELKKLISLAKAGLKKIFAMQKRVIEND